MEQQAYKELENVQNIHWWFTAKREIIISILSRYKQHLLEENCRELRICDIGCGMGVLLKALSKYGNTYGMDCEPRAIEYCSKTLVKDNIFYGKLPNEVPFAKDSFDIIVSSDCLEHVDSDMDSMVQIRNLLKNRNSFVIITVPALMCLWSYNDVFVHHKRRYDKKQLMTLAENAGFHIEMCSYYNFWLFPIIWIIRKFKNLFHIKRDDLKGNVKNNLLNKMLYIIFSSEKHWLQKINFPIGVSLILVATKGELND